MANFKLTELNSITDTQAGSLIYIVQQDLSKSITIESLFNNVPAPITTTGGFDIVEPGINGGQYLSGGQEISSVLSNSFTPRYTRDVYYLLNIPGDVFTWPADDGPITPFGNSVVSISGGAINPPSAPQRLNVRIPNSSEESLPEGWNIKLIQTGELPIYLSAGAGVTIFSVNNTLSSGYTGANAGDIPYSFMEVYRVGTDQFVVTHSLSCNGLGTDRSDWA